MAQALEERFQAMLQAGVFDAGQGLNKRNRMKANIQDGGISDKENDRSTQKKGKKKTLNKKIPSIKGKQEKTKKVNSKQGKNPKVLGLADKLHNAIMHFSSSSEDETDNKVSTFNSDERDKDIVVVPDSQDTSNDVVSRNIAAESDYQAESSAVSDSNSLSSVLTHSRASNESTESYQSHAPNKGQAKRQKKGKGLKQKSKKLFDAIEFSDEEKSSENLLAEVTLIIDSQKQSHKQHKKAKEKGVVVDSQGLECSMFETGSSECSADPVESPDIPHGQDSIPDSQIDQHDKDNMRVVPDSQPPAEASQQSDVSLASTTDQNASKPKRTKGKKGNKKAAPKKQRPKLLAAIEFSDEEVQPSQNLFAEVTMIMDNHRKKRSHNTDDSVGSGANDSSGRDSSRNESVDSLVSVKSPPKRSITESLMSPFKALTPTLKLASVTRGIYGRLMGSPKVEEDSGDAKNTADSECEMVRLSRNMSLQCSLLEEDKSEDSEDHSDRDNQANILQTAREPHGSRLEFDKAVNFMSSLKKKSAGIKETSCKRIEKPGVMKDTSKSQDADVTQDFNKTVSFMYGLKSKKHPKKVFVESNLSSTVYLPMDDTLESCHPQISDSTTICYPQKGDSTTICYPQNGDSTICYPQKDTIENNQEESDVELTSGPSRHNFSLHVSVMSSGEEEMYHSCDEIEQGGANESINVTHDEVSYDISKQNCSLQVSMMPSGSEDKVSKQNCSLQVSMMPSGSEDEVSKQNCSLQVSMMPSGSEDEVSKQNCSLQVSMMPSGSEDEVSKQNCSLQVSMMPSGSEDEVSKQNCSLQVSMMPSGSEDEVSKQNCSLQVSMMPSGSEDEVSKSGSEDEVSKQNCSLQVSMMPSGSEDEVSKQNCSLQVSMMPSGSEDEVSKQNCSLQVSMMPSGSNEDSFVPKLNLCQQFNSQEDLQNVTNHRVVKFNDKTKTSSRTSSKGVMDISFPSSDESEDDSIDTFFKKGRKPVRSTSVKGAVKKKLVVSTGKAPRVSASESDKELPELTTKHNVVGDESSDDSDLESFFSTHRGHSLSSTKSWQQSGNKALSKSIHSFIVESSSGESEKDDSMADFIVNDSEISGDEDDSVFYVRTDRVIRDRVPIKYREKVPIEDSDEDSESEKSVSSAAEKDSDYQGENGEGDSELSKGDSELSKADSDLSESDSELSEGDVDSTSDDDEIFKRPVFTPKTPGARVLAKTKGLFPKPSVSKVVTQTPLRTKQPSVDRVRLDDNLRSHSTGHLPQFSGFLKSLSEAVPAAVRHPEANRFVTNFKKEREVLTKKLFTMFNETVFENKLPADLPIQWNSRLNKTAGYCAYRKTKSASESRSARVELSVKVCDSAERVRDTLVHELCHAAVWLIHGVNGGHGPWWKCYAAKAMKIHRDLPPISRCHNYEINYKYTYKCTKCGYKIGRHSKSLDTENKRCGYCHSPFECLVNTKNGPKATPKTPRTPNRFAMFVKENYGSVKRQNTPLKHRDIMQLLGTEFAAKNKISN